MQKRFVNFLLKKIISLITYYFHHQKEQRKLPKKYKSVLLINHEPTVRNLIRSLTKNHNNNHFKLLNYKFPTSAFAKIYFDFNEWNKLDGNGLIKEFTRPKDLQDSKE